MQLTITIGGDPDLVKALMSKQKIRIEQTDLLYAGERQKTRILKRTAQGKDYLGRDFARYSKKGPYYYYPQRTGGVRERSAIARNLQLRVQGGTMTRSGLGIRYDSYDAFKRALGRSTVDLTGPRAPHMLQALTVQVRGNELLIGIWGAEAPKASGHNEGIMGRLPQRRFLDISQEELRMVGQDVATAMAMRLSGKGIPVARVSSLVQ